MVTGEIKTKSILALELPVGEIQCSVFRMVFGVGRGRSRWWWRPTNDSVREGVGFGSTINSAIWEVVGQIKRHIQQDPYPSVCVEPSLQKKQYPRTKECEGESEECESVAGIYVKYCPYRGGLSIRRNFYCMILYTYIYIHIRYIKFFNGYLCAIILNVAGLFVGHGLAK